MEDARIVPPAGWAEDRPGIFTRTILTASARLGKSMLNIWINTVKVGILCEGVRSFTEVSEDYK